jgi:hypothetical protein
MPAIGPVLSQLITQKMSQKMKAISGTDPMSQKNPAYFKAFCTAIGNGIALGTKALIFTTQDKGSMGTPPIPGKGLGMGIIVDDKHFSKTIYTKTRSNILKQFKKTTHKPWPGTDGSGRFLRAMAEAIAEAVKEHYAQVWILNSVHSTIYAGTGIVGAGKIQGVVAIAIQSQIIQYGPTLAGPGFMLFAKAIAEAYEETITKKATGKVQILGLCIPSQSQVCGLPSSGSGTGVAI